MTEFYQIVSMSRLFETQGRRVFQYPTLRNLTVPCMGLLRFSLFEAVEKSVRYSIRAKFNSMIFLKHLNGIFFTFPRLQGNPIAPSERRKNCSFMSLIKFINQI